MKFIYVSILVRCRVFEILLLPGFFAKNLQKNKIVFEFNCFKKMITETIACTQTINKNCRILKCSCNNYGRIHILQLR